MLRNYLHCLGFQLCILFVCESCSSVVEREIDSALSLSGSNRAELEAVLFHYAHDSILFIIWMGWQSMGIGEKANGAI